MRKEDTAHIKELVDRIAEKTGLKKKDIKPTLQALMEVINEIVEEDRNILLRGFCTVKTVTKPARRRYYTHAGKVVDEPEHKRVVIETSNRLNRIVEEKDPSEQEE